MSIKVPETVLLFFHLLFWVGAPVDPADLLYNGFRGANLTLSDLAAITPDGLLRLTNETTSGRGLGFYGTPFRFHPNLSFSTSFVFAAVARDPNLTGVGVAFVISPSGDLPGGLPSRYLGIFNLSNDGNSRNHILAVEFNTIPDRESFYASGNRVEIDINGVEPIGSAPAAYFAGGRWNNFSLSSGVPVLTWIDYSGRDKLVSVTVSPLHLPRPRRPLLSATVDLAAVLVDPSFVGFCATTGQLVAASHYILGWSFKMNGPARSLDLSSLPSVPRFSGKHKSTILRIVLPIIGVFILLASLGAVAAIVIRRKIIYAEVLEDWEDEYGPHRFRYKDLFIATKGFPDKELLGCGGFGRVYRGFLPSSKTEVAVKRVSHDSNQGMKEFVAEIASLGRLRHRNLVQLLGYCRRERELLLVYDYMPNGSLDKLLFDDRTTLSWSQRFRIVKGVASGLLYLHEGWEQVVVHRDVKASNVLLDGELNGRLGDFGLARLYDHGTAPRTTHVVGTLGYLAPELFRTSNASPCTDVFAFGAFLLEVATGRRPLHQGTGGEELVLVDWVLGLWRGGSILEASDDKLGGDYVATEMEFVMKLGLLCSHPVAAARPSMRQVVKALDLAGDDGLQEMDAWKNFDTHRGFDYRPHWNNSSSDFGLSTTTCSVGASSVSGGT